MELITFTDEIKEAKNPLEKNMLLQKYGMIEPKLTAQEQADIRFESAGIQLSYGFTPEGDVL